MERRVILAIVLMLIVAVLPSILFPGKKRAVGRAGRPAVAETVGTPAVPQPAGTPSLPTARPPDRRTAAAPAETIWVTSPRYRLGFSTR